MGVYERELDRLIEIEESMDNLAFKGDTFSYSDEFNKKEAFRIENEKEEKENFRIAKEASEKEVKKAWTKLHS